MHILILSDNFYPEYNAAATRVYERACYWAKWGHQVTVVTSVPNFPIGKVFKGYRNKWYQKEVIDGINVIRVKTFIYANKGLFLRVLDFLSYMIVGFFAGLWVKKPDVIFATSPQFFTTIAGYGVSLFKRKPLVLEIADLWPASVIAVGAMKHSCLIRLAEKVELFLYRRAKKIIVLTSAFKTDMIARGIVSEKISVILNGVELSHYTPRKKNQSLLLQYHLKDNFIVGFIGNHGMAQDLKNVLLAAKMLIEHKKIHFVLVGSGVERDDLLNFAEQNNLANVTFISAQPKEKIADYWSLCDVALVHLKNADVFKTVIPSKIFEAMAMGLPILLVSPEGEASQLILKEKTGVWVSAGDSEKLAQTILDLYQNSDQLQFYTKTSLQNVKQHTREEQARRCLETMKKTSL